MIRSRSQYSNPRTTKYFGHQKLGGFDLIILWHYLSEVNLSRKARELIVKFSGNLLWLYMFPEISNNLQCCLREGSASTCLSHGNFIITQHCTWYQETELFLITFLDDMMFNCIPELVGVVIANLNLEHFVFHCSTLCGGIYVVRVQWGCDN